MSDSGTWIEIVLLAMLAGFIGLRLVSVLGKRTGDEKAGIAVRGATGAEDDDQETDSGHHLAQPDTRSVSGPPARWRPRSVVVVAPNLVGVVSGRRHVTR